MTFRSEVRKSSCRRPSLCAINILPVAQVARVLSTQMLMWPVGVGLRFSYTPWGFFWIIHLFLTTYYFVKWISDMQIFLQYLLFFLSSEKETGIHLHWCFLCFSSERCHPFRKNTFKHLTAILKTSRNK